MKYQLQPFGKGSGNLKTIEFTTKNPATYILGRNATTGLDKLCDNVQHVSRNHIILTVRSNGIFMHPIARQDNLVYYNEKVSDRGEKEMKPKDHISMLGSISYFNYELVQIGPDDEDVEPPHKKLRTAPLDSDTISAMTDKSNLSGSIVCDSTAPIVSKVDECVALNKTIDVSKLDTVPIPELSPLLKKLLRQYECSICYETLACTYSLSPCGDCFCFTCIEEWSHKKDNCPHCQSKFDLKNAIPNKNADNSIRAILEEEPVQLSIWESRVSEGIAKVKEIAATKDSQTGKFPEKSKVTYRFMNHITNPSAQVPPAAVNLMGGMPQYPLSNTTRSTRPRRANAAQQAASIVDLT